MRVEATAIADVQLFQPTAFTDNRGSFSEVWERDRYVAHGLPGSWRQDNVVHSQRGVLRGLHFQHPRGQHKLVSVIAGKIFDVAVDVRLGSPTFGKWVSATLSGENRKQLSIPPGFAHGYLVLSEGSIVTYKCSERYDPAVERSIRWDDPRIAIDWPCPPTLVSGKDQAAPFLDALAVDILPRL